MAAHSHLHVWLLPHFAPPVECLSRLPMQEWSDLVQKLCGASAALRLICTSRRNLGPTLPECIKVDLEQLDGGAAVAALQYYSSTCGTAVGDQALKELSVAVCARVPLALSIVGSLLRDAANPVQAAQVCDELQMPACTSSDFFDRCLLMSCSYVHDSCAC